MGLENEATRVLIVDDSVGDFDLVSELLEVSGEAWTFEHAPTWDRGITALREGTADVALVDYRLGGRDGLELVDAILAEGCSIPLVLLTGEGREGLDRAALTAGAADYLDKNSLAPELLATTLRRAIARQRFLDTSRPGKIPLDPEDRALRLGSRLVDGLLVCSPTGQVLHATPEAEVLFGRSLRELREFSLGPLADGHRCTIEIPDGGQRHRSLSIRCAEVLWERQPALVVGVIDRSGRALAEGRLAVAEKMATVGRFAGGIAHDFNNVLQGLVGHLDLCLTRRCEQADCRCHLEQASSSAHRAVRVVQRLLAFTARRQVRAVRIDPAARIRAMEPLLRQVVGPRIELQITADETDVIVSLDPTELDQVVMNLVTNAAEAAGPGGRIAVRVARRRIASVLEEDSAPLPPPGPGVYAVIEVEDDGPGIGRDELGLIFEPFYSSGDLGTASGLGLAIVEAVVRERGGFIAVWSAPGSGARFQIGLPLATGAPRTDTGPQELPLPQAEVTGTILLVDDDRAVLSALEGALVAAGHRPLVADRGEAALELLVSGGQRPDLLVTDIVMPGMDGFELADLLRAEQPELPVLFITGYGKEVLASRGLDGSQVEILQKPFRMAELVSRVAELLGAGTSRTDEGGQA